MFLFERIEALRSAGVGYAELPQVIPDSLNDALELRPYQEYAFRSFVTYFENDNLRQRPTQVLFHMATGSGKTLIMAGLIAYLYQQGYRNFLFFVNLGNIVRKTKDNFLNPSSSKYLFANEIVIDGEIIKVNEVSNFQGANPDAINIYFTTIQGLHMDMWYPKENSPSFDDFENNKTVLIADEAHHLNVDTRKGKLSKEQEEVNRSWETTVNRIFNSGKDNILLEFTATCDLENDYILSEYKDKIIFDYPLRKFREEKYSKDVRALRADLDPIDRALLAMMFSQFRLKLFEDQRLSVKPVLLFKSKTIQQSKDFESLLSDTLAGLDGDRLLSIVSRVPQPEVSKMMSFFEERGLDGNTLAQELKDAFNPLKWISVNSKDDSEEKQLVVNSMEDASNPYRAIFAVDKLNEGWDCLNLFDIVRVDETRDGRAGAPGKKTIAEAQLIGRGARYFPFVLSEYDERYKRKFDDDADNPLRTCEELLYHCYYERRYFDELKRALVESGIAPENNVKIQYALKDSFKEDSFYLSGIVFSNSRVVKSRINVVEMLPSIRDRDYFQYVETGRTDVSSFLAGDIADATSELNRSRITVSEIAKMNYSTVHAALRKHPVFRFDNLKRLFPHLSSTREFIEGSAYLGGVNLVIETGKESLSMTDYYTACYRVFEQIGNALSSTKEAYEGTREFSEGKIRDIFKDKVRLVADPSGEGEGISQSAPSVRDEWRINLAEKDWHAFNDNYGTSEEKAFVAYFASRVDVLLNDYEQVYLLRNERQLAIYSFDGGERFEPDYLLFLRKQNAVGFEQFQIFVEPKGSHLIETDKWKEDFLLEIENLGIPTKKFADDDKYHIWGFPFFNQENRGQEFSASFGRLIES